MVSSNTIEMNSKSLGSSFVNNRDQPKISSEISDLSSPSIEEISRKGSSRSFGNDSFSSLRTPVANFQNEKHSGKDKNKTGSGMSWGKLRKSFDGFRKKGKGNAIRDNDDETVRNSNDGSFTSSIGQERKGQKNSTAIPEHKNCDSDESPPKDESCDFWKDLDKQFEATERKTKKKKKKKEIGSEYLAAQRGQSLDCHDRLIEVGSGGKKLKKKAPRKKKKSIYSSDDRIDENGEVPTASDRKKHNKKKKSKRLSLGSSPHKETCPEGLEPAVVSSVDSGISLMIMEYTLSTTNNDDVISRGPNDAIEVDTEENEGEAKHEESTTMLASVPVEYTEEVIEASTFNSESSVEETAKEANVDKVAITLKGTEEFKTENGINEDGDSNDDVSRENASFLLRTEGNSSSGHPACLDAETGEVQKEDEAQFNVHIVEERDSSRDHPVHSPVHRKALMCEASAYTLSLIYCTSDDSDGSESDDSESEDKESELRLPQNGDAISEQLHPKSIAPSTTGESGDFDDIVAKNKKQTQDQNDAPSTELYKQVEEVKEQLDQEQIKKTMFEDEATMYKGMFEDLQEDYNMLFAKYNEYVEQNASLPELPAKVKQAEHVNNMKVDQINTLKEQRMALHDSGDAPLVVSLRSDNEKLRRMVEILKETLHTSLR